MVAPHWGKPFENDDEVDQLLLNAKLRDELEPYFDESIDLVNVHDKPTSFENEYLASMLAWERAPVIPISHWFEPPLVPPAPERLCWREIHETLWDVIHQLYEKHVVLEYTEHLSDYQLYCLIIRDILPSHEKKIDLPTTFLHWHCLDPAEEVETWLTFYASDEDRRRWERDTGDVAPPVSAVPFPRTLPRR